MKLKQQISNCRWDTQQKPLRRLLLAVFTFSVLVGCSKTEMNSTPSDENSLPSIDTSNQTPIQSETQIKVDQAIANAISNSDLRLLATTGRRLVLPGIKAEEQALAKTKCGFKRLPNSGDIIGNSEDKNSKQKALALRRFAELYNQQIYLLCVEQVNSNKLDIDN